MKKAYTLNPDNLQIVLDKRDTAHPYRVMDISGERTYITFFCKTKEEAQEFIENPQQFLNPITKYIKEYCSSKSVRV